MSQKFLIAIDEGSPRQNDAITLYLRGKGWHVWHWLANLWLLSGVPDEETPRSLYSELVDIPTLGGLGMLVMKIDGESLYYGGINPDAWSWLRQEWGRPDVPTPIIKGVRFLREE